MRKYCRPMPGSWKGTGGSNGTAEGEMRKKRLKKVSLIFNKCTIIVPPTSKKSPIKWWKNWGISVPALEITLEVVPGNYSQGLKVCTTNGIPLITYILSYIYIYSETYIRVIRSGCLLGFEWFEWDHSAPAVRAPNTGACICAEPITWHWLHIFCPRGMLSQDFKSHKWTPLVSPKLVQSVQRV